VTARTNVAASTVRPLSLGEILDRAVTLAVRNFIPLAAAFVLVQIVNSALYHQGHSVSSVFYSMAFAGSDIARSEARSPFLWLSAGFTFLITPLSSAALVILGARAVLGERLSVGSAYRKALARWPSFIAIGAIGFVAEQAMFIGPILILGRILNWIGHGNPLLSALVLLIGLAATLMVIAATSSIAMIGYAAAYSFIVEGRGFFNGVIASVRRALNRSSRRQTIAAGAALFAIMFGTLILEGAAMGISVDLFRAPALGLVATGLIFVAVVPLLTMFGAVYYFDLRVREGGVEPIVSGFSDPVRTSQRA